MEVDDRDLGLSPDLVRLRARDVAPHQVLDVRNRAVEPPHEGVHRPLSDRRPRPEPPRRLVVDVLGDEPRELEERPHFAARDPHPALAERLRVPEPRGDVRDDERVLLLVVLGVREEERQESLAAELGQAPEVGTDPRRTRRHVGGGVSIPSPRRSPELDAPEGVGHEAQLLVPAAIAILEPGVPMVEKEQVFPLDVVDEGLGVQGIGPEDLSNGTGCKEGSSRRSSSSRLRRCR